MSNVIAGSTWLDSADPYTRDTFDVDDVAARIVEAGADVYFLSRNDANDVAEYVADVYGVDASIVGGPRGWAVVLRSDALTAGPRVLGTYA